MTRPKRRRVLVDLEVLELTLNHYIQNMLTPVLTVLQQAEKEGFSERHKNSIVTARKEAKRISELIRNIGNIDPKKTESYIDGVFKGAKKEYRMYSIPKFTIELEEEAVKRK